MRPPSHPWFPSFPEQSTRFCSDKETSFFGFGEEVASLSGSSGGESPARTALLLVLNWSDCSKSVPVPLGRKSLHGLGMNDGLSVGSVSGSKETGVFGSSEIGKFVESNGEGLVGSIVGIDEVQVRLEDFVSEKE